MSPLWPFIMKTLHFKLNSIGWDMKLKYCINYCKETCFVSDPENFDARLLEPTWSEWNPYGSCIPNYADSTWTTNPWPNQSSIVQWTQPSSWIICIHPIANIGQLNQPLWKASVSYCYIDIQYKICCIIFWNIFSADDLKLSLRHAKYQPYARRSGSSKLIQLRSYSQKYDRGIGLDLGLVQSSSSYLPGMMAAT